MDDTTLKGRVLLAEDDYDIRLSLCELLRGQGYMVTEVSDGAALLDALASSLLIDRTTPPPDAVVSDVRMPGFNGLSVLEGLRWAGWMTPFIVITAFGDEQSKARADEVGATAFFEKPIDYHALEEVLDEVVKKERDKSRDARRAVSAVWEGTPFLEAARCLRDDERDELVVVRRTRDNEVEACGIVSSELILDTILDTEPSRLSDLFVEDVAVPWYEAEPVHPLGALMGAGANIRVPAIVRGKDRLKAELAYITKVEPSGAH